MHLDLVPFVLISVLVIVIPGPDTAMVTKHAFLAGRRGALFASIALFGITIGNLLMLQPLLVAQRFGVLDYPRIYSRLNLLTTFGIAAGPFLLGWIRDSAGGYRSAYLVAAACSATGGAVLTMAGPAEVEGM